MTARMVVLVLALPFLALPRTVRADDLKAMEGLWVPMAVEIGEQQFSQEVLKTMQLRIEGSRYTTQVGNLVDKGNLVLDTSTKPRSMKIIGVEGPNKGKTFPAIYEVSGDYLRVCYALDGKAPPETFKVESNPKFCLIIYRRFQR